MIKVQSQVPIYEINNKDIPLGQPTPYLTVKSHWNEKQRVVLEIEDKCITVYAQDLMIALKNAINSDW